MRPMKIFLATIFAIAAPLATYAGPYQFTTTTDVTDLAHGTATTWGLGGSTYTSLESAIKSGQTVTSATLTLTGIYDWTSEKDDVLYVNILNNVANSNYNKTSKTYTASQTKQVTYDSNPVTNDTVYGEDPFVVGNNGVTSQQPTPEYTVTSTGLKTDGSSPLTLAFTGINPGTNQTQSLIADPGFGKKLPAPNGTVTNSDPGTYSDYDDASVGPNGVTVTINLTAANIALLESYLSADDSGGADLGLGFGADCHFYDSGVTLTINAPDSGMSVAMLGIGLCTLVAYSKLSKKSRLAT